MGLPNDIYSIILSIVAAFLVYRQKDNPVYLKAFLFFLLVTMGVEIAGGTLSEKKINTILLYNIFTSFEFVFYLWVIRDVISNLIAKRVVVIVMYIYPILAFFEIWVKPDAFHAVTDAIGCLLIVIACIYYFLELFQLSHSVNLLKEPAFWICSGLLFFYSCTFPIYGAANFIIQLPNVIVKNLAAVLDVMNILLYSSFAIAFLCRLKVRKYIL